MPRLREVKVNVAPEIPVVTDDPDKSIIVDVSDKVEAEEKDAKGKEEPEIEVVEAKEPEGEDDEKVALRKRVEELTNAEKAREAKNEAERAAERAEAQRQIERHQNESIQYKAHAERANLDAILNAIDANKTEADKAQGDYEVALSNSDYKAASEAQRRGQRAEAQLVQLEQGKDALEAHLKQMETAPRREAPADPVEASIANLPDPAKVWLRSHRDYMTDQRKNAKIQALHWEVIDEGHQPFSQGYFESLETHLGMREKPKESEKEVKEPVIETRRNPPVSAPVTRDVPSVATGKPTSTRVTLDPTEREHAKIAGITDAEYAKQKLRLAELKRQGHYSENR